MVKAYELLCYRLILIPERCLVEDHDQIVQFVQEQVSTFLDMSPKMPVKNAIYKSVIIAFPYLPREKSAVLKAVRSTVKPGFIQSGITCGEFYPDNPDASARNPHFPIRSHPALCIIVRYLVKHDSLFLKTQPELYALFKDWMSST